MLDEKRIKEAQKNVATYLEDGMLSKLKNYNKKILGTYERNCKESLSVANKLFEEDVSNLWVIVSSYYSMFYIANAVLYKIGYKTGDRVVHKVTYDALIVYIRNRLKKSLLEDFEDAKEEALEIIGSKTDELISNFDRELDKRSVFQYETTEEIKRAKAETSLQRAKEFVNELRKLL